MTSISTQATEDPALLKLTQYISNVNKFNKLFPQEKVYLHFDNTSYFLGENIWFKAYVVTAEQHELSALSRILYVELLAPDGAVVDKRKLKIEDGQCHGEFELKRTLSSGYYEVRAYTRYMLNFGEDIVFSRVFPILNPDNIEDNLAEIEISKDDRSPFFDKMRKERKKEEKVNLSFYPEGGSLVNGLITRIAFKATDENGKSIDVEGRLYNSRNEEVAFVQTTHQGMGVFDITPLLAEKQTVIITKDKKKYKFELPNILPSGYVMNLVRYNDVDLTVQVQKTPDIASDLLGLSVSCRGKVYLFESFSVNNDAITVKIPTETLPVGVNRLTLFNSEGRIYSDRLFYVDKEDKSRIIVTSDKQSYQPYEKVELSFQVLDNNDIPEEACFSLSIRDSGTELATADFDNIRTNLLLSSELKGYVENPSWYFKEDDKQHAYALDLLMMVQGWRRYSWEQASGISAFNLKHPVEKEILVTGHILSLDDRNKPQKGITVGLEMFLNDTTSSKGSYLTDADGQFQFSTGEFNGSRLLILTTDTLTGHGLEVVEPRITLDRQFAPVAKTYTADEMTFLSNNHPLPFAPDDTNEENSLEKMQFLQEIAVSATKIRPDIVWDVSREVNCLLDLGENLPYSTFNDYFKYRDKNFGGYPNPKSLLASYKGTSGAYFLLLRRGYWGLQWRDEQLASPFLFDHSHIKEFEKIVISFGGEKYRHYRDSEKYRQYGGGGLVPEKLPKNGAIIFVYIYEKNIRAYQGTRYTELEGYSTVKEFYSLDYEKESPISGEIDDRRTLYWNPNIKTDDKGKASVHFYKNSSKRKEIISAEGMTKGGRCIMK